MPRIKTAHKNRGVVDVASGDSWEETIDDEYARVTGIDLVGDVERDVYIISEGNKHALFNGNVRGQGDLPIHAEVSHGDKLKIDYKGTAEVSDVWLVRTDRPLEQRIGVELGE